MSRRSDRCFSWDEPDIVLRYVKHSVAVEKLIEYVKWHDIMGNTNAKLAIVNAVTNVDLNT